MYSVTGYGTMIADPIRIDAYAAALRATIRPDSIVADIGTGTGIFALLAARYGARRIYAIEPDSAISVARENAVANGSDEKIVFIEDLSTRTTLPEPVDVIVSDLRGVLPHFEHHLRAIIDARERFLVPGGVLIPRRDSLWAAVVSDPDLYRERAGPWDRVEYGLDMSAARRITTNTWTKARFTEDQLLSKTVCWAMLDYSSVKHTDIDAEFELEASDDGPAHGFAAWFDSEIHQDITLTNAPGSPALIYGNAYFPWPEEVSLRAGDRIRIAIKASLVGENYLWSWKTRVRRVNGKAENDLDYSQSTFFGVPLSGSRLQDIAADHVPTLNEEGKITRQILEDISAGRTLGDIADRIVRGFPSQFSDRRSALAYIGDLCGRFT